MSRLSSKTDAGRSVKYDAAEVKCVGMTVGLTGTWELPAWEEDTRPPGGAEVWDVLLPLFVDASSGSTAAYGGGGASSWSILRRKFK